MHSHFLLINIVLGVILTEVFNVAFSYVIIATLLTYLYYSFMCVWKGKELLGRPRLAVVIKSFFHLRLLIPYVSAFAISVLQLEYVIWLPLVLYVCLNWRDLITLKNMTLKLINNPNIADI